MTGCWLDLDWMHSHVKALAHLDLHFTPSRLGFQDLTLTEAPDTFNSYDAFQETVHRITIDSPVAGDTLDRWIGGILPAPESGEVKAMAGRSQY